MSIQEKIKRLKITPLPMPTRAVPILMSLDDESLPKEIKQRVKESDVESIVYRDKVDSINANYTITYRNYDKDYENMCCMKYILLNNFVINLQFIFHK